MAVCNLPPPTSWPPDGCADLAAVAPPATPIPPACVLAARVAQGHEGDLPYLQLTIFVEHPEINPWVETYTRLTRYDAPSNGRRQMSDLWELTDADWRVDCGKDEGPLTWASLQVLNVQATAGLAVYRAPLPDWYTALLRAYAPRPRVYLPMLEKTREWP